MNKLISLGELQGTIGKVSKYDERDFNKAIPEGSLLKSDELLKIKDLNKYYQLAITLYKNGQDSTSFLEIDTGAVYWFGETITFEKEEDNLVDAIKNNKELLDSLETEFIESRDAFHLAIIVNTPVDHNYFPYHVYYYTLDEFKKFFNLAETPEDSVEPEESSEINPQ